MVCEKPISIKGHFLPCGHCILCRIKHAAEWSYRLTAEMSYWTDCSFVTLTYNDESCPVQLEKPALQKFIKRLRKKLGRKIKYFACGEYGDKFCRPHYHGIFFGVSVADEDIIRDCWPYGFITVSVVKKERINYVTRYCLKKFSKKENEKIYEGFQKPFQLCSQGLGLKYCIDNALQLCDNLGDRFNRGNISLPRYFVRKLNIDSDILHNVSNLTTEMNLKEHNMKYGTYLYNDPWSYRNTNPSDIYDGSRHHREIREIAEYRKNLARMSRNLEKKKGRI